MRHFDQFLIALQIDGPAADAADGVVDQEAGRIRTGTLIGGMTQDLDVVEGVDRIVQTDADQAIATLPHLLPQAADREGAHLHPDEARGQPGIEEAGVGGYRMGHP